MNEETTAINSTDDEFTIWKCTEKNGYIIGFILLGTLEENVIIVYGKSLNLGLLLDCDCAGAMLFGSDVKIEMWDIYLDLHF